ncbi:MAG: cation diffusion facilitator family transporter [Saccharolobus sp.]
MFLVNLINVLRTLVLLFSSVLILLIAYYISASPLLLSEFSHALIDFLTILSSFLMLKILQNSYMEKGKYTYGLHRLELFISLINITAIVSLSIFSAYISIISFFNGVLDTHPIILLIASSIVAILTYFSNIKDSDEDLGKKSIYTHILSDLLGYLIGILVGVLILVFNIYELDPIGALVVVGITMGFSVPLLKETLLIFMEGSPVNIDEVERDLKEVSPNIHHIHIWSICSHIRVATLHVKVEPTTTISEADKIRDSIYNLLKEKYNISHITVQFETSGED